MGQPLLTCLSYTEITLSKLFGGRGKKIMNIKWKEKIGLLSCVSHCDIPVTFIFFSLYFPSQYFFKEMISKGIDMIFIEKFNSKVKQGCNIVYLTSSTESRQSLYIYIYQSESKLWGSKCSHL